MARKAAGSRSSVRSSGQAGTAAGAYCLSTGDRAARERRVGGRSGSLTTPTCSPRISTAEETHSGDRLSVGYFRGVSLSHCQWRRAGRHGDLSHTAEVSILCRRSWSAQPSRARLRNGMATIRRPAAPDPQHVSRHEMRIMSRRWPRRSIRQRITSSLRSCVKYAATRASRSGRSGSGCDGHRAGYTIARPPTAGSTWRNSLLGAELVAPTQWPPWQS